MKIGILKEGKTPPDSRVPLTPEQCRHILDHYPVELVVQESPTRSYRDEEYRALGIPMARELMDCDVILGVKEVPISWLLPAKTYFFFSHTIKEQAYNRQLLKTIVDRRIRLIDYEVLVDDSGRRVIAFGKYAGMVGAHNALYTYAQRTGKLSLPRMKDCPDYAYVRNLYQSIDFPPVKIVLTGTGNVGQGAEEVLLDMGIQKVEPEDFLHNHYEQTVFTQLFPRHYVARTDGGAFDKQEFYTKPSEFTSIFKPYTEQADIFINGIYWDNDAPAFFTQEDMRQDTFRIEVISDVTCDIAPISSIPSTLRATTIADPIMGYDPISGEETAPHQPGTIDMMTIDNLPNELPRDASAYFGSRFVENVLENLLSGYDHPMMRRGIVAENGDLGEHFEYLREYLNGEDSI